MDNFKNEEDEDDSLADFNPPPNPELTSLPNDKEEDVDSALSPEAFNNINVSEEKIKQYYNNYIPYYEETTNVPNIHGSEDDLMKKLNYDSST